MNSIQYWVSLECPVYCTVESFRWVCENFIAVLFKLCTYTHDYDRNTKLDLIEHKNALANNPFTAGPTKIVNLLKHGQIHSHLNEHIGNADGGSMEYRPFLSLQAKICVSKKESKFNCLKLYHCTEQREHARNTRLCLIRISFGVEGFSMNSQCARPVFG